MTSERWTKELELLRGQYGDLTAGENMDWVKFKAYPLPAGWDRDSTELLVMVPPGYPVTPPDNFFVRNGLRLADGSAPANFAENQTVLGDSWAQFSFHAQEWRPAADFLDGDNLLTLMFAVGARLAERN